MLGCAAELDQAHCKLVDVCLAHPNLFPVAGVLGPICSEMLAGSPTGGFAGEFCKLPFVSAAHVASLPCIFLHTLSYGCIKSPFV